MKKVVFFILLSIVIACNNTGFNTKNTQSSKITHDSTVNISVIHASYKQLTRKEISDAVEESKKNGIVNDRGYLGGWKNIDSAEKIYVNDTDWDENITIIRKDKIMTDSLFNDMVNYLKDKNKPIVNEGNTLQLIKSGKEQYNDGYSYLYLETCLTTPQIKRYGFTYYITINNAPYTICINAMNDKVRFEDFIKITTVK